MLIFHRFSLFELKNFLYNYKLYDFGKIYITATKAQLTQYRANYDLQRVHNHIAPLKFRKILVFKSSTAPSHG